MFDELSDSLCKVADLSEFIRLGHPNGIYSQSAEDACISISGIVEKLVANQVQGFLLKHLEFQVEHTPRAVPVFKARR